jgi:hypothetical protein
MMNVSFVADDLFVEIDKLFVENDKYDDRNSKRDGAPQNADCHVAPFQFFPLIQTGREQIQDAKANGDGYGETDCRDNRPQDGKEHVERDGHEIGSRAGERRKTTL